jgi:hypothetical protein
MAGILSSGPIGVEVPIGVVKVVKVGAQTPSLSSCHRPFRDCFLVKLFDFHNSLILNKPLKTRMSLNVTITNGVHGSVAILRQIAVGDQQNV